MILDLFRMPRFDAMDLVLTSRAVLGFNLSFFAEESALIETYMKQLLAWVESKDLVMPDVTIFPVENVGEAHELIQSGTSVGKIVIENPVSDDKGGNDDAEGKSSVKSL